MNYLDYIEKQTHGTPDFPLAYYYVDETHPNYDMPFHWHKEMEISYILQGRYTFYLGDDVITARQGDVVFINQGIIHGGKPDNCTYECVVFDPKPLLLHSGVCGSYIRNITASDIYIPALFSREAAPLQDITQRLMAAARNNTPGSELSILGALYEWFGYIYRTNNYTQQTTGPIPDTEKMQVLKPVLEYMEQFYMRAITLEELAKLAGMSTRYFCRFFRALIHQTPIEYLNYYRVERACYLLATTDRLVTEIAYLCGFNDSGYFVKIFKKYKGTTPKQYQMQYK